MIHPVAGKCKHCKADLTAHRAARPAASAPLPALQPAQGGNGHSNGHAAAHAPAAPIAVAHDVQPVLPPRPTTRGHTAEPSVATWRSWPVLVIVLAMGAIVAAVVLMVWPANERESGKRMLQPPPAPERMLTDPDVKSPQPDPRAQPRPDPGAPDPWRSDVRPPPSDLRLAPPPPPPRPPDPDTADDQDVDALDDPFASNDPAGQPGLGPDARRAMAALMIVHLCRKLFTCRVDDPAAASMCNQIVTPQPPPPPSCPAAIRCLQHIDALSCDSPSTSLSALVSLMSRFDDCAEAASC